MRELLHNIKMVKGDILKGLDYFSLMITQLPIFICVSEIFQLEKNNFQVAISFSLFHFIGYNWNPLQLLCHKDSLIDEAVIIMKENVKFSIKTIGG